MRKLILMCMALLLTVVAHAQTRTVTGVVVNSDKNEPLVGASVNLKGTTTGKPTDIDDKFSIKVPEKQAATLTVKYIDFADLDFPVSAIAQTVTIRLVSSSTLNEVVVTGFGQTVRCRDLNGSVASVKAADIVRTPATTVT